MDPPQAKDRANLPHPHPVSVETVHQWTSSTWPCHMAGALLAFDLWIAYVWVRVCAHKVSHAHPPPPPPPPSPYLHVSEGRKPEHNYYFDTTCLRWIPLVWTVHFTWQVIICYLWCAGRGIPKEGEGRSKCFNDPYSPYNTASQSCSLDKHRLHKFLFSSTLWPWKVKVTKTGITRYSLVVPIIRQSLNKTKGQFTSVRTPSHC